MAPPRRHWRTYVWPAIALGPVGGLLAALRPSWEAVASVWRPGLLGLSRPAGSSIADRAAGKPGRSAISNLSAASSRDISLPAGGEISLLALIISAAALMALLVCVVRLELGPMYRWPQ